MTVTKAEWLACTDPQEMLNFLRGKASDRKARLLMAAACRRVLHLLDEPQYLALVEAGERVVEGALSPASLARCRTNCPPISLPDFMQEETRWQDNSHEFNGPLLAKRAVWLSGSRDRHRVEECLHYAARGLHARHSIQEETANQCHLIRDIFGNPFRPVTISPAILAWNDAVVVRLAKVAYEQRQMPSGMLDNVRLAVLADALEEAGCTDTDILGHLRGPGPHVRGCWVVDLCLGKA
jgi:hypothetical protein